MHKIDFQTIGHYQNYPNLRPFVGKKYGDGMSKLLFVGESHYLPGNLGQQIKGDFYKIDEGALLSRFPPLKDSIGWLKPSIIIGHNYMKGAKHNKAFTIFSNIGKSMLTNFDANDHKDVWDYTAFLNYYLRPAEKEGESIKADNQDNHFAYENLIEVSYLLKPDRIIFLSSKAFKAFKKADKRIQKCQYGVDWVPHPGSAWWNRKAKKYGENSVTISGKEKFEQILRKLNPVSGTS